MGYKRGARAGSRGQWDSFAPAVGSPCYQRSLQWEKEALGHSSLPIHEPGTGTLRVHPNPPQLRVCHLHSSSPWSQMPEHLNYTGGGWLLQLLQPETLWRDVVPGAERASRGPSPAGSCINQNLCTS